jgi:uncharacterized protein
MKCPSCDHLLHISERLSVEIDYCPHCHGVWLDKGELDKIIRLANQQINDINPAQGHQKNNKKSSFLSDLFDFG